ncbi:uncharacterized protein N7496_003202 [Penicillium cataractarum]|uniref:Uncharacterized protein n=1 Tax=Penicillium cataractarum TaxID=2100454 RepID=A0A9W9SN60_9EURO|nr:uncharacterized protein N7496_003202 [Penicillium cataractarum]KAJ5380774.1 hypothetical protein N7496_003202 [Penicillium cataractarum]
MFKIPDFNSTDIFAGGPDPSPIIEKYGGWHMNPSNVMFTNGQFDPWRSFTVRSEDTQLGAPRRQLVQDIPACNVAPGKDTVFGVTYPGQVHEQDIKGDVSDESSPLRVGLDLYSAALDKWLPFFEVK